jgi:hypothetical protein
MRTLKAVLAAGNTCSRLRSRHTFLNIIVAEETLNSAKQAAIDREISLRRFYVPHMPPCRVLIVVGMTFAALAFASPSLAEHYHPLPDEDIHEKVYSTWRMPDRPWSSCCNNRDCYPTEVRIVGGDIFTKRREDGKFIAVRLRRWSATGTIPTAAITFAHHHRRRFRPTLCSALPSAPACELSRAHVAKNDGCGFGCLEKQHIGARGQYTSATPR